MSQTVRAFVAVEIEPEVRRVAAGLIDRLRASGADVKWVAPENLHLTLKFLGDVPLTETARVCQAMARAAEEIEPFVLELGGAGAFPSTSRPRTIWLGARGDDQPVVTLHKHLEARLQKLGFRKDGRRFQPHLTLGRAKKPGPAMSQLSELLVELAEYPAGAIRVGELVLFSSQLTREGPIYQPLGRARLGGA